MPQLFNIIHESNMQGYTYMILSLLGYKCQLEYYYLDEYGSYRFDLVILDDFGEITMIVEFKRKEELGLKSGLVDCYAKQTNKQLEKYCNLVQPIYVCVGINSVKALIAYVLNNY